MKVENMDSKFIKPLVIAFYISGLAEVAYAAPVVDVVTGTSQHGATLTISGSSFGTGKTSVLLWDDFEGGSDGAAINASPQVGSWNRRLAPTTYTIAQKHSGQKSLYARRSPGDQWGNFEVTMTDSANFYQSFWFRYNYPAGQQGQTKLVQVHGTYGVGDYNPGVMTGGFAGDYWSSYIALENSGVFSQSPYTDTPTQGAWHHFEAILKQSSVNVADGMVIIKIDGVENYNKSPVKTREKSGERWDLVQFLAGMTNFTDTTESWIDDVYLNDSWARVEIGDKPSYSASTRREIQLHTSWSSSNIAIKFNQGAFQSGQTAYVFVVDSNGVMNSQGYPVTIGVRSVGFSPPTGLRVVNP